jgi:hypothetical protein
MTSSSPPLVVVEPPKSPSPALSSVSRGSSRSSESSQPQKTPELYLRIDHAIAELYQQKATDQLNDLLSGPNILHPVEALSEKYTEDDLNRRCWEVGKKSKHVNFATGVSNLVHDMHWGMAIGISLDGDINSTDKRNINIDRILSIIGKTDINRRDMGINCRIGLKVMRLVKEFGLSILLCQGIGQHYLRSIREQSVNELMEFIHAKPQLRERQNARLNMIISPEVAKMKLIHLVGETWGDMRLAEEIINRASVLNIPTTHINYPRKN